MGFVSDIITKGYGGYAGWGDAEAQADFNATKGQGKYTGGGGGGGGSSQPASNPVDDLIKQSIEAYQKQLDDYAAKTKEFDESNPFVFDDVLSSKRLEVADRLDPYYNQTLEDYVRGVNVRRTRSLEDEKQVLSELTADVQDYTGKARSLLEDAIDKSREGFADANTFFSGTRLRDEGKLRQQAGESMTGIQKSATRRGEAASLATERGLQDLSLEEQLKRRDIQREKYAKTETGAINETNLAQLRRDVERNQYVGAPYASQSLSQLPSTFLNYI